MFSIYRSWTENLGLLLINDKYACLGSCSDTLMRVKALVSLVILVGVLFGGYSWSRSFGDRQSYISRSRSCYWFDVSWRSSSYRNHIPQLDNNGVHLTRVAELYARHKLPCWCDLATSLQRADAFTSHETKREPHTTDNVHAASECLWAPVLLHTCSNRQDT